MMQKVIENSKTKFRRGRLHYMSAMIEVYKKQMNVETRIDEGSL